MIQDMYRIQIHITPPLLETVREVEDDGVSSDVSSSCSSDCGSLERRATVVRSGALRRGDRQRYVTLVTISGNDEALSDADSGCHNDDSSDQEETTHRQRVDGPTREQQEEYDLEQKIDLEIRIREGTTKLLAASRNTTQSLEAAKNLITSNERMQAYMAELQYRRNRAATSSMASPSKARMCVSDIRIPLMWKDRDHFKNRGDYRRFAVFCLCRVGTEIYDTIMLNPVDRSMTDLSFEDVMVFSHVPADFEFRLEVYSHELEEDLSMASTPRKLKQSIHTSISRTVGRKLAASLKDELRTEIGPKFDLVATAKLRISDVSDNVCTHDLQVENVENSHQQLPLFGHFCCRLAGQPDCVTDPVYSANVLMWEENKQEDQEKYWAKLQAFLLDLWSTKDDWEKGLSPKHKIIVNRDTRIMPCEKSSRRLKLMNMFAGIDETWLMELSSAEDYQRWMMILVQHVKDHQRWLQVAENTMEIHSPATVRKPFLGRKNRFGSLYEETAIAEEPPLNSFTHRSPTMDLFTTTSSSSSGSSSMTPPASPATRFRPRSYSASAGAGSNIHKQSQNVKSHWLFSRAHASGRH